MEETLQYEGLFYRKNKEEIHEDTDVLEEVVLRNEMVFHKNEIYLDTAIHEHL